MHTRPPIEGRFEDLRLPQKRPRLRRNSRPEIVLMWTNPEKNFSEDSAPGFRRSSLVCLLRMYTQRVCHFQYFLGTPRVHHDVESGKNHSDIFWCVSFC